MQLLMHRLGIEPFRVAEALAALSPYLTQPIHRFGRYQLDMEQRPPERGDDLGR
jgi:hypothetical protein